MTPTQLRPYLEAQWSIDTTYTPDDWREDNPARGQCAVTAVYLWRMFGGSMMKTWVREGDRPPVRHYVAHIGPEVVDWTWKQFSAPQIVEPWRLATLGDLVSDSWMRARCDLFADRVDAALDRARREHG